jgi:hypothetical protein
MNKPRWCGCEFNNVPCPRFNGLGKDWCCVCGHPEICHLPDQGYEGQPPLRLDTGFCSFPADWVA